LNWRRRGLGRRCGTGANHRYGNRYKYAFNCIHEGIFGILKLIFCAICRNLKVVECECPCKISCAPAIVCCSLSSKAFASVNDSLRIPSKLLATGAANFLPAPS